MPRAPHYSLLYSLNYPNSAAAVGGGGDVGLLRAPQAAGGDEDAGAGAAPRKSLTDPQ